LHISLTSPNDHDEEEEDGRVSLRTVTCKKIGEKLHELKVISEAQKGL
jgi:hypothetical protein